MKQVGVGTAGKVLGEFNQMSLVWCQGITPHLPSLSFLINYEVGIDILLCSSPYFNSSVQPNDISFILSDIIGNIEV